MTASPPTFLRSGWPRAILSAWPPHTSAQTNLLSSHPTVAATSPTSRRNTPRPPRLEAAYGLGRPRSLYRQEGHRHRMSDPLDLAGPGRVLRPPFMPTSH